MVDYTIWDENKKEYRTFESNDFHKTIVLMNAKYHQSNVKIDALIKEIIDARKEIKQNERDNLINHWLFCGGLVILSLIVIFK